ncbi:MAG: ankyrin repeat domain-containing protein [Acidobacteria bacterium]|nr:ankyrin repeat domain-containing protein [Acidobacteriota bacterium]
MLREKVVQDFARIFLLVFLAAGFSSIHDSQTAWSKADRVPDLIRAIRDNNVKRIDKLIDSNMGINAQDEYGWTPLMYAIFSSHSGLVDRLLSHGADPDSQDQDGVTPLIAAIIHMPLPFMVQHQSENQKRAAEIPLLLLHKGADPDRTDNDGNTPLIYAAVRDQLSVIDTLLRKGADPNRSDRFGRTALYFAENPEQAKEWAPAMGILSSSYRMRRQSDGSNFIPQYSLQVGEARAQANVMLEETRTKIAGLLRSAGAEAPDAGKIHAAGYRVDNGPQRLGSISPSSDPLGRILLDYARRTRRNAGYHMLVCIGPDGKVKKAIVLQGVDGISEDLRKAALKFEFMPAMKDGAPVEAWDVVSGFVNSW